MAALLIPRRLTSLDDHIHSFSPDRSRQELNVRTLLDMSRGVGEISVERVEKIDAGGSKTTTAAAAARVHGAAGARAGARQLVGIDAAAAAYIEKVHRRIAAEEAAADAIDAAKRNCKLAR